MKTEKQKQLLLEQFRKIPIVQVACEKTQISRAAYYKWRDQDPVFAEKADEALTEGVELVSDMSEAQLISAIKDRDLRAIIFWLKARHKAYSNKIELSGKIRHEDVLSPEQEKIVAEALALAAYHEEPINNELPPYKPSVT